MKEVIRLSDSRNSFRVLKGGWGDAFSTFLPEVRPLPACSEGRVEFIEYVRDIRSAYEASRLLLFPSFTEGYGLAAVEAMAYGTPVVCSNHPAILEAAGDAAITLCPYRDSGETWAAAVDEMLADREDWIGRAQARARTLADRQDAEVTAAAAFLADQAMNAAAHRKARR
jgi:glycosyltransferase involved in cell wall biosynthesis